jgi:hypothetical protein
MAQKMRWWMRRIALTVMALIGLLYAGDYASVRFRIPKRRDPFGVVQVRPYYAVPQKNGKPEFYFLDPQNQTCVHSLFPHLGYNPCWYVSRHARQRIDM